MGDLNTQTVQEIWNGEAYRELRRQHARGEPDEMCRRCFDGLRAISFNAYARYSNADRLAYARVIKCQVNSDSNNCKSRSRMRNFSICLSKISGGFRNPDFTQDLTGHERCCQQVHEEIFCLFCSFARLQPHMPEAYTMSLEQAWDKLRRRANQPLTQLHIVNGLGSTDCTDEERNEIPDCPNGLGNLIVGYNEPSGGEDFRTGSPM